MDYFDYIIIGAGSAGCVLANRLSADSARSVLLLEAGGPDSDPKIHIPGLWGTHLGTQIDWAYETTEQVACHHRKIHMPRGKVYGGSSSINAMIYQRGHPNDYAHWTTLGNEGWDWEDVLPYFKKGQDQARGESDFHATGGPLHVTDLLDINPLSKAFVESATAAGYLANTDFNDGNQDGFGLYQATQKGGRRQSSAEAFLRPALERSNLRALPFATVLGLKFERKRCVGVNYVHEGKKKEVSVGQEVIICGGAINSPQLLLLSGIGPAGSLHKLGINMVQDLPGVGQNLQDHVFFPHTFKIKSPISYANAFTEDEMSKYSQTQRGAFSSTIAEAGGFVRLSETSQIPEIQFHFVPSVVSAAEAPEGTEGFSVFPGLVHVQSKGEITLQSADPFVSPFINPNYLSEESDQANIVKAFQISQEIVSQLPLKEHEPEEFLPRQPVTTYESMLNFIRSQATTMFHPAGTCKMGNDPNAVVNDRLQVHGVKGVRVADVSIMPTLINANTNAPAMMIGEKCADMILNP
ncbi:MAG: GMC family oxidoreductase N-terminal domain-containing protein [Chloroflexota bacterium]